MQAERCFFGVDGAHLRQAARAGRRVFRPRVELAGVAQSRFQQELIDPVARRGGVGQIGERPRVGDLQQRGRGLLGRLNGCRAVGGLAELGGAAGQAQVAKTACQDVQPVGSVGVALQELVGFPVAGAPQPETCLGLRTLQRWIRRHGRIGRGQVLVAPGEPLRQLLLVGGAYPRIDRACVALAERERRPQRVVVGRLDRRPVRKAGARIGVAAQA